MTKRKHPTIPKPATRFGPTPSQGQSTLFGDVIEVPDKKKLRRRAPSFPSLRNQSRITDHLQAAPPVLPGPQGPGGLEGSPSVNDDHIVATSSPVLNDPSANGFQTPSASILASSTVGPSVRPLAGSPTVSHNHFDPTSSSNDDDLYDASPVRPKRLHSLAAAVTPVPFLGSALSGSDNDDAAFFVTAPTTPVAALSGPVNNDAIPFVTGPSTSAAALSLFGDDDAVLSGLQGSVGLPPVVEDTVNAATLSLLGDDDAVLSGPQGPVGLPPGFEETVNGMAVSSTVATLQLAHTITVVFRPIIKKMHDNAMQYPSSADCNESLYVAVNLAWAIQQSADSILRTIMPWVSKELLQLLSKPHITIQELEFVCPPVANLNTNHTADVVRTMWGAIYLIIAKHTDGGMGMKVGWSSRFSARWYYYASYYNRLAPSDPMKDHESFALMRGNKRDWTICFHILANAPSDEDTAPFGYFAESMFMLLLNTVKPHLGRPSGKNIDEMARKGWIHNANARPVLPGPKGPSGLPGAPPSDLDAALLPLAQIDQLNSQLSTLQICNIEIRRFPPDGTRQCVQCGSKAASQYCVINETEWQCRACELNPKRTSTHTTRMKRNMESKKSPTKDACDSCGIAGTPRQKPIKGAPDVKPSSLSLTRGGHMICTREERFFRTWGILTPRPPPADGHCENKSCRTKLPPTKVVLMYSASFSIWHCYRSKRPGGRVSEMPTDLRCIPHEHSIPFTTTDSVAMRHQNKELDEVLDRLALPGP
ncbi:MAG: hypothetical protein Q9180_001491 [Flavoplaca navasiana]